MAAALALNSGASGFILLTILGMYFNDRCYFDYEYIKLTLESNLFV